MGGGGGGGGGGLGWVEHLLEACPGRGFDCIEELASICDAEGHGDHLTYEDTWIQDSEWVSESVNERLSEEGREGGKEGVRE